MLIWRLIAASESGWKFWRTLAGLLESWEEAPEARRRRGEASRAPKGYLEAKHCGAVNLCNTRGRGISAGPLCLEKNQKQDSMTAV